MLTKCPECGHDVSSTAEKCPNCGAAIGSSSHESLLEDNNNVQIIEFTPKHYKAQRIWSWVLFIVGVIIGGYGINGGMLRLASFGGALVVISIVWGISVSLAIWWHHG